MQASRRQKQHKLLQPGALCPPLAARGQGWDSARYRPVAQGQEGVSFCFIVVLQAPEAHVQDTPSLGREVGLILGPSEHASLMALDEGLALTLCSCDTVWKEAAFLRFSFVPGL